jgi:putative ABC transport system permease protein
MLPGEQEGKSTMNHSTQSPATRSIKSLVPVVSAEPVPLTPLESVFYELQMRKFRRGQRRASSLDASLGSALESLWANRLRSALTVLGILIGVAAVIGSLTLTQGVSSFLENRLLSQGANTIFIQPGVLKNQTSVAKQSSQSLTLNDLQSLSKLSNTVAVSPIVNTGDEAQVIYGNQNWSTQVQGVNTDFQIIQNWELAQGDWFSPAQDAGGASVAVIGDAVRQNLFSATGVEPVGKQIRIRNQLFRVVGVLALKGGGQDNIVFVPYKAALARLINQNFVNEIRIKVDTPENIALVQQAIIDILRQKHHVLQNAPDDFQINTSIQMLQHQQQQMQATTALLLGIATISLTVGGVSVMNIMLVAVTERTREIGIRMSIGAREGDIRNQFLIEVLALCLAGGLIGMLLGLFIGWMMTGVLLSALTGGASNDVGIPFIITPLTLMLPLAVSLGVGLIFGIYPAVQASRLDPIIALRHTR